MAELVERQWAEAAGPLERLLLDREASIRACAAWALGELALPRSAKPLAAALGDLDADVRRAAVQALAQLALPESEAALLKASSDADRWVGEGAQRGLTRLRRLAARSRKPRTGLAAKPKK